jgi:hypothetical protein
MHRGQRIWLGVLIGFVLTTPFAAVLYAGFRRAGLPFVPFNLFDWVTRRLPGAVVAAAIGGMIRVIRGLNIGPTSTTAKLAEQTMAVVGFVGAGMILGAMFFFIAGLFRHRFTTVAGWPSGVCSA